MDGMGNVGTGRSLLCEQIADAQGYETSVVGKHRCGNQILKTIAGIVGRTLDYVETSAVWKLSEFGMLSIDPRATRNAGRKKNCNSQHSAKLPSHCEISVCGFDRHAGAALKAARVGRHRPSASRESARTGLAQFA